MLPRLELQGKNLKPWLWSDIYRHPIPSLSGMLAPLRHSPCLLPCSPPPTHVLPPYVISMAFRPPQVGSSLRSKLEAAEEQLTGRSSHYGAGGRGGHRGYEQMGLLGYEEEEEDEGRTIMEGQRAGAGGGGAGGGDSATGGIGGGLGAEGSTQQDGTSGRSSPTRRY